MMKEVQFSVDEILMEGDRKAPIRMRGMQARQWALVNYAKGNICQPLEMFDEAEVKSLQGFYKMRNGKKPSSIADAIGFAKRLLVDESNTKSLDQTLDESGEGTETLHDIVADPSIDVCDQATTNAMFSLVEDCIPKLDPRQRGILQQYYFDGFNQEEIGDMQGVSSNWIGQIQKKAINNLRTTLNPNS